MISNRNAVIEMTIGLLVMAGVVQADPTFINACPAAITSPGRYLLGADLICGGGGGITITSSDVTLAFEGHRITAGEGAGAAILVNPSLSLLQNVHIFGSRSDHERRRKYFLDRGCPQFCGQLRSERDYDAGVGQRHADW
jgi:hypothetical protein